MDAPPAPALSLLVHLLASGLCASVVVHLWQRRDEPGVPWLLALAGSVGILTASAAGGALVADPGRVLVAVRFGTVFRITAALAWCGFALTYSGLATPPLRRSWIMAGALLAGGSVVAALLAGSDLLVAGLTPASGALRGPGWIAEPGPAAALVRGTVGGGVGLATLILFTHLAQASGHWRERAAVLAAPGLVWIGAALGGPGEGAALPALDPLPAAAALAVALLGHVLVGDRATGTEPVARSAVVEEMTDPVLVLGRDGRPVDLNRAAREQLGLEVRGPLPFEIATLWAASSEALRRGVRPPRSRVELDLVYGTRAVFELTMTPLGPRAGRHRSVLVLRDVTERERMERELRAATESLRFLANTDVLTGLVSRRRFEERLRQEVERAHRYGRPLALVLLDLDHFKRVNDTWGHPTGDRVLRGTADAIRDVLREMDVAGRLGGEELAVLLPETDRPGAEALAERLRRQIGETVHRSDQGRSFQVTASLGITWLAGGGEEDAEALLSTADQALYQAKVGGRDRVVSRGMDSRADRSA